MPITCVDGEISNDELAIWEVTLPPTRVALLCEEVRAVFVGSPLVRGIAILGLSRVQLDRLFPTKTRKKLAWRLMGWARKIRGEEARRVLGKASWHQLRAAARYDDEEGQIQGALAWTLGLGR